VAGFARSVPAERMHEDSMTKGEALRRYTDRGHSDEWHPVGLHKQSKNGKYCEQQFLGVWGSEGAHNFVHVRQLPCAGNLSLACYHSTRLRVRDEVPRLPIPPSATSIGTSTIVSNPFPDDKAARVLQRWALPCWANVQEQKQQTRQVYSSSHSFCNYC